MILSIQYMRAVAAILVVLSHISWKSEQNGSNLLYFFDGLGGIGVNLFFVISGFIMIFITETKEQDFKVFLTARFIRIIPLYWLLTTVALIIYLIRPELINSSGGETLVFNSYFLIPSDSKFLVNNGWTLSYEFYFYFLMAIAMFISFAYRSVLVAVILAVLFAIGFIYSSFLTSELLLLFLLGVLSYSVYKTTYLNRLRFFYLLSFIVLCIVQQINLFNSGFILESFAIWFGFLYLLSIEGFFLKHKDKFYFKAFHLVGDSSYSLYLLHPFILAFVSIVFSYSGLVSNEVVYIFVMFFVSLISGYVCYKYIEIKLNKSVKSFYLRWFK